MMNQIHVKNVTILVNVALMDLMTVVPNVTMELIGMKENALQNVQIDIIKMTLIILVKDVTDLV